MPSPIALLPSAASQGGGIFKLSKKSSQRTLTHPSASEYLAALKQADNEALARSHSPPNVPSYAPSVSSVPALSFASTAPSTLSDSPLLTPSGLSDDDPLVYPDNPPTSNDPPPAALHSEFGYCNNEDYRYTSAYKYGRPLVSDKDPPMAILLAAYLSYLFLIAIGHTRDFFGKRFWPAYYKHLMPADGYAALNSDFDSFYTRRLKSRIDDCFERPVTGVPGRTIVLYDRETPDYNVTFNITGKLTRALNMSSYNYLGFAQATGAVADQVEECLKRYGVSSLGPRSEAGTLDLHNTCEQTVARFLGVEDSMVISMGFATNSSTLPTLVGRGCLIISDEYNHASIRTGVRMSGANVRLFKHNNMESLEQLLRESISQGQPRTHRPWKKILIVVEGLYSMEGTFCNLPALLALKKRYKFYLYVDEAHSIGAVGPHGRGVCDYFGVDPSEVDVLMGTFTKSFGASGGYIAGKKDLIDRLRLINHAFAYAETMGPPILAQIIGSMSSIMGVSPAPAAIGSPAVVTKSHHSMLTVSSSFASVPSSPVDGHPTTLPGSLIPSWMHLPSSLTSGEEGASRLRRIAFNSRYLSQGLRKLGFIIYGQVDSPIVPLVVFSPGKMATFSRLMLAGNLHSDSVPVAVVIVGYPATPLVLDRIRFCVSSSHTKADIDRLLRMCDTIGDLLGLKQGLPKRERWTVDEVIDRAVALVHMD